MWILELISLFVMLFCFVAAVLIYVAALPRWRNSRFSQYFISKRDDATLQKVGAWAFWLGLCTFLALLWKLNKLL